MERGGLQELLSRILKADQEKSLMRRTFFSKAKQLSTINSIVQENMYSTVIIDIMVTHINAQTF